MVPYFATQTGDMPMSDTTTTESFQPPYMSWATFENMIETLGARGLPDRIDRSLLTSRSGGDQAQFLKAARAFGLIDDEGRPLDRFKAYVSQPERRRDILREVLTQAYPDIVNLGTGATPAQLTTKFREFGIEGDTVRKAETFYLNAARQAEIELSPHFKNTRPGAGGSRKRAARSQNRTKSDPPGSEEKPPTPPAMHPAITTLVQSLPRFQDFATKPVFSEADREAWFAYAKATFNLIYASEGGPS